MIKNNTINYKNYHFALIIKIFDLSKKSLIDIFTGNSFKCYFHNNECKYK